MTQALEEAPHPPSPRAPAGGSRPTTSMPRSRCSGPCCCRATPPPSAIEFCTSEDFYKPAHAHIFGAITALYTRGEPADPVTVADELRRSGLLEAVGGPVGAHLAAGQHPVDGQRLPTTPRSSRSTPCCGGS